VTGPGRSRARAGVPPHGADCGTGRHPSGCSRACAGWADERRGTRAFPRTRLVSRTSEAVGFPVQSGVATRKETLRRGSGSYLACAPPMTRTASPRLERRGHTSPVSGANSGRRRSQGGEACWRTDRRRRREASPADGQGWPRRRLRRRIRGPRQSAPWWAQAAWPAARTSRRGGRCTRTSPPESNGNRCSNSKDGRSTDGSARRDRARQDPQSASGQPQGRARNASRGHGRTAGTAPQPGERGEPRSGGRQIASAASRPSAEAMVHHRAGSAGMCRPDDFGLRYEHATCGGDEADGQGRYPMARARERRSDVAGGRG
jgi:hypothetical protein